MTTATRDYIWRPAENTEIHYILTMVNDDVIRCKCVKIIRDRVELVQATKGNLEHHEREFIRSFDTSLGFRREVLGQSNAIGEIHRLANSITGQRECVPVKDWTRN